MAIEKQKPRLEDLGHVQVSKRVEETPREMLKIPVRREGVERRAEAAQQQAERNAYAVMSKAGEIFGPSIRRDPRIAGSELGRIITG